MTRRYSPFQPTGNTAADFSYAQPTRPALMTLRLFLTRTSLLIAAAVACLLPSAATAQTITPVSVQATMLATNDTSQAAANNTGEFTAILYGTPAVPLPAVLAAGNYPAWCGTKRLQSFGNDLTYTAT